MREVDLELTHFQRCMRIHAQADRLAYFAGFTVPDPHIKEPKPQDKAILEDLCPRIDGIGW